MGDAEGFAQWTPPQPTLDLPRVSPSSPAALRQHEDVSLGRGMTKLVCPAFLKILHRAVITLTLKKRGA